MKSSTKSAARSRMALSYQTAQRAVAYEKSRAKPEDVRAPQPTFRNRLVDWASRTFARFLAFFGYHRPDTAAKKRQKRTTPPRAFGTQKRPPKLYRRMKRYRAAHPVLPMKIVGKAARRQFAKEIGA